MVLVATLLVVGALLMFLEVILPGMVAGTVGLLCLLGGVLAGYQEFGAVTGNWILIGTVVGLLIGTACWLKYFPDSRIARLYIAHGQVGEIGTHRPELIGQTGAAHTQLRPSGTAVLDGQRVDVVTEGDLIERGTPVKVVAVEGLRVVVRKI